MTGRTIDVVCPSGLSVRLRGIKGRDLDGLRDKRRLATGEAFSTLLDDCTLEVLGRGPYERLTTFAWADVLMGDRMRAIIAVREATSGASYDFRVRCRDGGCKQMIDWTLELNQLPVKSLPAESIETFMNGGNVFETTCAGAIVKFKLTTGREQARLQKLAAQLDAKATGGKRPEGRTILGLAGKITSVDGSADVMEWLLDLGLSELAQLTKDFDAVDCGVQTGIEVVCHGPNGCGMIQEVELPLDSRFFSMA